MMKNYVRVLILAVLLGGFIRNAAYSQIVGWQFSTPESVGNEASAPASYANDGLTVTDLTRGAGWMAPSTTLPRGFVSSRVGTATDTTGMVAQDMYFGFNVTVKSGYKASLSNIIYKLRLSSAAGAKLYFWKYSLDGTHFNKINDPVDVSANPPTGEGAVQPTVNLSGIPALQDLPAGTTVYLRLYAGNSGTGTTAIGRSAAGTSADFSLSVGGSVENLSTSASLLAWQFGNPSTAGNEVSIAASLNNSNLETATLSRGDGLNNTATYSRAFSAIAKFASTNDFADTAIAVANDMYFTFSATAKTGYNISLSKLNYKVRRSAGGSQVWYWKYSVDGTHFVKLAEPYLLPEDNTYGIYAPSIDLSSVNALQDVVAGTTVYFRVYVSGSNNSTGSTNIGVSDQYASNSYVLSLDGTVESTLPVNLTSFTGKSNGSNILLNWQTASEKNNAYFEVLRIREGQEPLVLGIVQGKGTTNEPQSYSFTDVNPVNGTNYYQLRQVDDNGNAELSGIIPVKSGLTQPAFNAFFNGDVLNISFTSEKTAASDFLLTDLSGRIIYRKLIRLNSGQNVVQVPVSAQNGIYVATLVNQGNPVISKKIMKL
ncbi:T9SS type A sorting domain-containing protein [Pedobacter sp. BS3]|uniref:T9SS type A sorting domain-containing protein n=1 Tax=Pedobacter sp. BS3 TaxID=2567937 RepID=UPI0011F041F1|nr:T9SS type A sorting domain-containing protein [Pedobacter sp. BS3]TZF83797.1 T9SS type A sorting domain-containing protein [Pedobacter sp. BS3]